MGDLRERLRVALYDFTVMEPDEAVDAVLTAIAEAGCVVAPVEPSEEMIDAGDGCHEYNVHTATPISYADAETIYRAMIRATQDHGKAGGGMGDG